MTVTLRPCLALLAVAVLASAMAPATALLAAVALGLTGQAVFCTAINPDYREELVQVIRLAACAGFVLTASLVLHGSAPAGRWRLVLGLQALLLVATGAALRWAAAV